MEEIWQFVSDNAQPLSAIVTFILACLTLAYVLLTRGMVIEMKNARETQLRPYIIIDFDFPKLNICDIVVKNVGNGAAFDVEIDFKPDVIYREPDIKLSDLPIFKQLKFFPAGKEFRFFFKSMIGEHGENAQNQFNVNLKYKDSAGKSYDDNLSLDSAIRKNLAFLHEKDFDDLVGIVERMAQSSDKVGKQVERLTEEIKGGLKIDSFETHSITQASKEVILGKLLEFKNIWNNLYKEDISLNTSYFKSKFKTLAFQITHLLSLNLQLEEPFTGKSWAIASKVFELSNMRLYADGGASFNKFNEAGKEIITLINTITEEEIEQLKNKEQHQDQQAT